VVAKKLWIRKKQKKLKKLKKWACMVMERKNKDVNVFVTGVSMGGETNLNEHHGTTDEDQGRSSTEEVRDSREDDIRENI
tara:strand:+ start:265 stop:504 length:240 start_codon:yes stop_codon:yes gene_type:complete